MNHIQENEIIRIDLLMIDDMYPTPDGTKVVESFGHCKALDINNGELIEGTSVAEGYRMVLELSAGRLCLWLIGLGRPFWMWDNNIGGFRPTLLKTSEANDA